MPASRLPAQHQLAPLVDNAGDHFEFGQNFQLTVEDACHAAPARQPGIEQTSRDSDQPAACRPRSGLEHDPRGDRWLDVFALLTSIFLTLAIALLSAFSYDLSAQEMLNISPLGPLAFWGLFCLSFGLPIYITICLIRSSGNPAPEASRDIV
jgi:hypothetical protein